MGYLIFLVLILVICAKSAIIVPKNYAYVIEKLGKYSKTLFAGFHILIPFLETISRKISLSKTTETLKPRTFKTKDNIEVEIEGRIEVQVVDPSKAAYSIDSYLDGVRELASVTLRSEIAKVESHEILSKRMELNNIIASTIDEASQNWGVRVVCFEIENVIGVPLSTGSRFSVDHSKFGQKS